MNNTPTPAPERAPVEAATLTLDTSALGLLTFRPLTAERAAMLYSSFPDLDALPNREFLESLLTHVAARKGEPADAGTVTPEQASRLTDNDLGAFAKMFIEDTPDGPTDFKCRWGVCPICERRTLFVRHGAYARGHFRCIRCKSSPRFRALIQVLQAHFPSWRELAIHESSPGGASSDRLAREGRNYTATHYFSEVPPGTLHRGYRSENLEAQTFPDECFDLVITQDVFEHVLRPAAAFAEIRRTLKPGGAHVFTVPWFYWRDTLVRAVPEGVGIRHLLPPDYHGNPIDQDGSLVITEWGRELCDFIYASAGMTTTVMRLNDWRSGIEGQFVEVFISTKSNHLASA